MRTYYNAVSGFKRHKAFENCGRRGVGRGNYGANKPYRLGNLAYAELPVILYYAAGLYIAISVVNILAGKMVFYCLVLHDTHAGFVNRHFCERNTFHICGNCCGKKYFINLLLSVGCVNLLSFSDTLYKSINFFNRIYQLSLFVFHNKPPLNTGVPECLMQN